MEGRTIPCAATSASHSASDRSLFRPDTFSILGVAEPQLVEHPFEGVVRGPPIDASRLHRHGRDRGIGEEDSELAEALSGRGEALFARLDLTVWIDDPTARDDRVPMDVEPGDAVSESISVS
jgi:hypothetical protein